MRIRYAREWGCILLLFLVLLGCSREGPEDRIAQPESAPLVEAPHEFMVKRELTQFQSISKEHPLFKKFEVSELAKKKNQISFRKGSRFSKKVALTFDDGPDGHYTLQILKILDEEKVPATFFVLGSRAKKYPDVLKKIDQDGHVIGNHSLNHPVLTRLSAAAVIQQVEQTNIIIKQIIGKEPLLFRPPYGELNKPLEKTIGGKGFKIIYWSVDTRDWDHRTPQQILQEVKKHAGPGAIILQHCAGNEGLSSTVAVLPQIIKYLRNEGYEFVTVDELLQIPAYR